MHVRVVYFEGCPNAQPAEAFVLKVADELGVKVTTELVRVSSAEEARQERMHGSPTIQFEGLDVDPAQRSSDAYSFGCRVFGGADGLPPREMLATALQEGSSSP